MPGRITVTLGRGRLQADAIAVGVFWPVIAAVFNLAVPGLVIAEPFRHLHFRRRCAASPGPGR